MFAVLGEAARAIGGGSRAAAILRLREALQDARDYAENREAFEQGERREYALSRLDLEALLPVVAGRDAAGASRSTGRATSRPRCGWPGIKLKLILAGAAEAWKVAAQIAAARVPVLITPLDEPAGQLRDARRDAGERRAPAQGAG